MGPDHVHPIPFLGMGAVQFVSIALPAFFWPVVVVLIAWWQRKPIGELIGRVRSGQVLGAKFDTAPPSPPSDLAEAVEGGASSPEVEEVIRSVSEAAQQSAPSGDESSIDIRLDPVTGSDAFHVAASKALAERLRDAQRLDEDRRRSEIERVMKSAARWGAKLARDAPNDADAWEPVVHWNDDGEPEVTAMRRPAFRQRMRHDVAVAQEVFDAARRAKWEADAEASAAMLASYATSDPVDQERYKDARDRVADTEHDVRNADAKLKSLRSALVWAEN
jgi:hypothetical protein